MELNIPRRAKDGNWCPEYDPRFICSVHVHRVPTPYIRTSCLCKPERDQLTSWPAEFSINSFGVSPRQVKRAFDKAKLRPRRRLVPHDPRDPVFLTKVWEEVRVYNVSKRKHFLLRSNRLTNRLEVAAASILIVWPLLRPTSTDWKRALHDWNADGRYFVVPYTDSEEPIERTSNTRNSGHLARWRGRMDQTTVGGFAGGGVLRADRSDPMVWTVVDKPIRISVPAGLMAAAEAHIEQHQEQLNAMQKAQTEEVHEEAQARGRQQQQKAVQETQTRMRESEMKGLGRAEKPSIVRYRTVHKARSSRFRAQTAAASRLRSYRRIHGKKSLLPPARNSCQVASANMDLVWSTASSIISESSSDRESEVGSSKSSGDEQEENGSSKHAFKEAAFNKSDTTDLTTSPPPSEPQPTNTPFVGSSTQFRPPWAFPLSDNEAEAQASTSLIDPDPWPEPDHRYTHLGPGRGKATRHLEAVSRLGFAGGGLRRPRASDVLPPLPMAGGGTIGRVMAVPDELRAAAEEMQKKRLKHMHLAERGDAHSKAGVLDDEEKQAKEVAEAVESERAEATLKAEEAMDNTDTREETKDERKARMVEKLFRQLEEAEADPVKGMKIARVSKTRDSGHNTRWARRMSVTTVSGFAGGGVPRPARDVVPDVDDDGWVGWKGKTKVPDGLRRAAERREDNAQAEGKLEDPEEVSWPPMADEDRRKEEWSVKWSNGEEEYWGEMASREFEVIEPIPVEETNQEMRQCLGTEEPAVIKVKMMERANGMSKYEAILSAALIVLAVLYAWELRGRYTA